MSRDMPQRLCALLCLVSSAQILCQERFGDGVELEVILRLGKSVSFILKQQVSIVDAALPHGVGWSLRRRENGWWHKFSFDEGLLPRSPGERLDHYRRHHVPGDVDGGAEHVGNTIDAEQHSNTCERYACGVHRGRERYEACTGNSCYRE